MHELSIVESLITLCEQNAKEQNATQISEVYVKIGRLSGIESELFKRCFDTFKLNSSFCKQAKLFIEQSELEITCFECGQNSILKQNEFKCPHCQSTELKIISGEDLLLMRLVMN
ncbi:hydrogenase maturation nickel metallochaperone HypA [Campylobacter sp. MIT 19-121]|uniref:hydrogenase maturation nickel metallochaperone HypA n=1 Tax=Campylobacter sp. MIT 19-121 TaxID=2703906 RepID=UPI0013898D51|nr:hydrogenase maturation nickel metallochaperone HypA [Campylobacter sp. MIT 19-121]NDJ27877.1 hydrogenase maturation nickel metallochaperone HypA [Campylobacter sp. MIT 19-121]